MGRQLAEHEIAREEAWNASPLECLREAYGGGGLALILGAGVSKGCGLPVWSELNARLLRRALVGLYETVGPEEAPLHARDIEATLKERVRPIMGRYVKAKLGRGYLDHLREALYEGPVRLSRTMEAILAMDRLGAILSLNFDDLLERFAGQLGVRSRYQTVYEAPFRLEPGKIPVYHTHGLLPAERNEVGSSSLVFGEDDLHELYHRAHDWSAHVTIQLLAGSTCLFVGTSGEDPDLRRLIDLARQVGVPGRHYLLLRPPAPLPKDARSAIRYSASRRAVWDAFEHLGLQVLWVHHYDRDIPRMLKAIGGVTAPASGRA